MYYFEIGVVMDEIREELKRIQSFTSEYWKYSDYQYKDQLVEYLYNIYLACIENNMKKEAKSVKKELVSILKKEKRNSEYAREVYSQISVIGDWYKFYLFDHKKLVIAGLGIIAICVMFFCINLACWLVTGNTAITGIKLYAYDGSSIVNSFEKPKAIDNKIFSQAQIAFENGEYDKSEEAFLNILTETSKEYGADSEEIASIKYELANTYLQTNNFENAYDYYMDTLVVWKKLYGADSENTNVLLCDLAICELKNGDVEQSLADFNTSLEKVHYVGDRMSACYWMASALMHESKYSEALYWAEKRNAYYDCLPERLSESGIRSKIKTKQLLGNCYDVLTRFEDAQRVYIEAIELLKEICGNYETNNSKKDLGLIAATYQSLGNCELSQNKTEKAVESYKTAMECLKKCYGTDKSPDIFLIESYIAYAEDKKETIGIIRDSLENTIDMLGLNNEIVAYQMSMLADYLVSKGQYEDAIAYDKQAEEILRNILYEKTVLMKQVYENLCEAYYFSNDKELAETYSLRAIDLYDQILDESEQVLAPTIIQYRLLCDKEENKKALILLYFMDGMSKEGGSKYVNKETEIEKRIGNKIICEQCKKEAEDLIKEYKNGRSAANIIKELVNDAT